MTNIGTNIGWLLACWGLLLVSCAVAQAAPQPLFSAPSASSAPITPTALALQPTYWKQRILFIPYQLNSNSQVPSPIAKVQLLYARTTANDWKLLQQAEPNVRGFSYHAPEDGEYWFALRHLDRRGQPWPNAEVRPQMRIVIDTIPPELKLTTTLDITGQAVLRYEARDANLNVKSLVVEVRGQGNRWTPLPIGTPDISYPNQLVGRIYWRPPADRQKVEVRAVIADRTNRRTQATTTSSPAANAGISNVRTSNPGASTSLTVGGPALGSPLEKTAAPPVLRSPFQRSATQRPATGSPKTSSITTNPFAAPPLAVSPAATPARTSIARTSTARLPARNWPASNRLPSASQPSAQINPHRTPPQANPYSVAGLARPNRTPAALVGDGRNIAAAQPQTLRVTPLGIDNAPPLTDFNRRQPSTQSSPWSAARGSVNPTAVPSGRLADRVVNSQTFDIDYDLQSVGPWGVSKVELWGTHDNGRTWQSYATDADNRSPIRVTVPTAGTFGFRILVDGANSVGSAPPQPGDEPELTVTVDLQPPTAKLLSAALGAGNLAGYLQVEWTAEDNNLESRPIALFYSSYPNGPWSTIATGLENTGNYTWRIERHIPARFYLRLEARDIAGNLATHQNPSPIELTRPQPKGRLRGVRSISESVRP